MPSLDTTIHCPVKKPCRCQLALIFTELQSTYTWDIVSNVFSKDTATRPAYCGNRTTNLANAN